MIFLTFVFPFFARVCIFIVNSLLFDPLPYVDEFLIGVSVISKVMFVRRFYKLLIVIIILGLIIFAFTYK